MANDSDDYLSNKTPSSKESESNKSFVKKVKSRVSGFLPSSISKWFGSTESQIRQREDSDDDEEFFDVQPPTKRSKQNLPDPYYQANSNFLPRNDRINHVDRKINSIFPEPMAGPSGIQSRKTFTPNRYAKYRRISDSQDVLNGDKYSDSGESTSGYSSMAKIGSKEQLTEPSSESKTAQDKANISTSKLPHNTSFSLNDRSLFNEKSLNSSLSSRQPSFNASVFGSPNFVDRTISSKRIMNSPFYNGRTIYGGASAYGRHLGQTQLPLRNVVQIKPVNDKALKDNAALSKTARRILDTLEQYTTPIAEAKKIPNPSLRKPLKSLSSSPYTIREPRVPSNKELQVPTVPDLLKMKLKERLQDSTESVRQIATTSKSSLNTEEYTIRTADDESGSSNNNNKHTNKMKSKVSATTRQKPLTLENEVAPDVKLPDIQLPISTLPKFDFSLSAPPSSKKSPAPLSSKSEITTTMVQTMITKSSPDKEETKTTCTKEETSKIEINKLGKNDEIVSHKTENSRTEKILITQFKFADPVVLAENNKKSIKAINNFIFSEPVAKKPTLPNNFKYPVDNSNNKKSTSPKTDNSKETVLNVLTKDTWECPVCLIRNVTSKDVKCKACNASSKSIASSVDKFKLSSELQKWECKNCRTLNALDENKCATCLTTNSKAVDGANNNFGSQFKLAADKWECGTCLVRNNVSDSKCVACTTPKPTTFGDKFKLPGNTWECPVCMIRNKNELTKCAACESPKPGDNNKKETPLLQQQQQNFGSNFKKKQDEWECDSCMVRNSTDLIKCQCCEAPKPGITPTPVLNLPKEKSTLSTFNFGIDKNSVTNVHGFMNKTNENGPAPASIFGQSVTTTSAAPVTFSFGIKPVVQIPNKADETTNSKKPAGEDLANSKPSNEFVFGINNPPQANNNFVFKEPPLPASTSKSININEPKVELIAKPASLNGDINDSSFKTISSAPQQINIITSSTLTVPDSKKDTQNLFSFGAKPQPEQQQQSEQPAQPDNSSTLFKFMPAEHKDNKPLFGSPDLNTTTPAFSNSSSSNSVFPVPFGSPAAPPIVPTAFGAQQPVESKSFTFGSTNEEPPTKVPMFSFGPAADKPKSNIFGTAAAGISNSAPVPNIFNAAPIANAVAQPSASGGFNFNAFTTPTRPAQNGAFNFGSNMNSTPKTGFSFGATPQPAAAAAAAASSSRGVFNFGAPSNLPPAASGGFNFGSSEVKPNFNFTGGTAPPTFSAIPGSTEKPRVMRRAMRRTQR